MAIADTLYWVMFECGFALIAACLPTLRFLFGKFSPDALISNLRSVISLNSLRSQRSQHKQTSRTQRIRIDDQFATSASSQIQFGKPGDASIETSAVSLRDLEAQREWKKPASDGQIFVQMGFKQSPH